MMKYSTVSTVRILKGNETSLSKGDIGVVETENILTLLWRDPKDCSREGDIRVIEVRVKEGVLY